MESHNALVLPPADPLLARATRFSHYARRLVEGAPSSGLDAGTARAFSAAEMRAVLAAHPASDEESLWRALRALRRQTMLRLMARDLGGVAPLPEVLATTTALAETAIRHALACLDESLAARHGRPVGAASGEIQQLHVVGMGKLGGSELNVSSDIDLVLVYPEDG
ncbi:MAG: bifunctional glutamine synthetase adenylyltransferase/deadenyltransferase, partial [Betaproteobacteria bacterium]|nr:bifunctional glutamine synthetase adenylyltransferase/deadenyltransferase [Betaproteobacteria bacterium]